MNHNYIRLVGLLDKSGSMQPHVQSTITAFNNFLNKLKADTHGTCRFKLIEFDTDYHQIFDLPLAQCPALTPTLYKPGDNMTALLDAQGKAIDELGEELRNAPEQSRPGKVVFFTISDGLENSSKHYTHGQVSEMIGHQQKVYSWDFVYLGANQDAIRVGASLNIPQWRSLTYDVQNPIAYQAAFNSAAQYVNLTRGCAINGQSTANLGFSEQDRQGAMGGGTGGGGTVNQSGTPTTTSPEEPAISSR